MNSLVTRSALLFVLLSTCELGAQQMPAFDPELIMMLGDADLDGRLSIDEYRELLRSSPRMRISGDAIDSMFQRFDADGDQYLSLAEYSKSFLRGPGSGPGRGGRRGPENISRDEATSPSKDASLLTREEELFFESKIRPILSKHCAECHSGDSAKLKGALRVDSREGLRSGGNSGPAIIPGEPDSSILIRSVRYADDELQMPPSGKLPEEDIAILEAWVKMGAPDPRDDSLAGETSAEINLAKARELWSFRVPQKSDPPTVSDKTWPRGEIDQFLLATMEARGLRPVQDASRRRLLRRVTFDLIGLPPTPDDVDAFLRDEDPDAFERVVDRLLRSQQFGEHWGRHWLDVARYAESSGKTNFTYPQAWRYRDWVIASLNADKPYDQFVREQIAGDLIPAENEAQRAEQLIGTGFLAIGSKSHESENHAQFALDVIDEQIEATTRAFLGLTVACARCHDHKLDPITQKDYYALSGILRSSQTCSGTLAGVFPNFNSSPLIELPAAANVPSAISQLTPEQRSGMERRLAALREERDAIPPGDANRDQVRRNNTLRSTLQHRLMMDRIGEAPRAFCMGIRERHEAINSRLYVRGELEQPGAIVPRALPAVFTSDQPLPISAGSGRLELANWLTARSNPLTARVMVNRIWLHLFGRGIVSTPDNFGTAGAPPGHPELLDHLAVDFMTDGWSIKRLIRRIVLSRAYGLDSRHDDRNFEVDPDNELVWRMSKRRLNAEVLRDSLLFAGGNLELRPPVGSAVARVGEGLAVFVRIDGIDVADLHRSVYLPIIREQVPESLTLFDFADPSLVSGERSSSTSPTQAFYFMNNALVIRQANALADRILKVDGNDAAKIAFAYELVFSRDATSTEQQRAARFMREFRSESSDIHTIHKSWSAFCQALFASGEFRYLD